MICLYLVTLVVLQVFSIVVFGCIGNQGWDQNHCFHSTHIPRGVCDYGTAVGVLAFLLLLAFLGADAFFDNVSNVQLRKYIVIADIVCFGKLFLSMAKVYVVVLVGHCLLTGLLQKVWVGFYGFF